MNISKRCDVPSCFLFVVVDGHVCVYVREPVVCFCFEDGITNVYVSTVLNMKIFGIIQEGGRKFLGHFKSHFESLVSFKSIKRLHIL